MGTPAAVREVLEELELVRAHALRLQGVAEPLGVNCVTWTLHTLQPGCLTLQDVVAGVVVRACALGAQRGLPAPVPVRDVAAAAEDAWEVLMSATACFFSWHPCAAGPTDPDLCCPTLGLPELGLMCVCCVG